MVNELPTCRRINIVYTVGENLSPLGAKGDGLERGLSLKYLRILNEVWDSETVAKEVQALRSMCNYRMPGPAHIHPEPRP